MNHLLAIETATEACSAALYADERIYSRFQIEPQGHSRLILPMVEAVLQEAGLPREAVKGIAFGRGPGSFTGVRIATGVAQGLAFARNLPVFAVSTLAALAQEAVALGAKNILAAIDARMGEVYWGAFRVAQDGLVRPVMPETVGAPEAVTVPAGDEWFGVGSGWGAYGQSLAARLGDRLRDSMPEALPKAEAILRLAALVEPGSADQALPVYLRDRVAEKSSATTVR
ncbi:MAG: tRNA (adenosine(37)-N6)-threonylcarbamoyltransferase complex dimerization subunit type 1 TsaB [Chromatiales bacterium]|nr:tRNA (adenosine(37)-N6)-threonylcarbamoyltransferase complex dimerization subunit type 1 TsaB [Chromatiales bacterium]